jgi:hypothetical protein
MVCWYTRTKCDTPTISPARVSLPSRRPLASASRTLEDALDHSQARLGTTLGRSLGRSPGRTPYTARSVQTPLSACLASSHSNRSLVRHLARIPTPSPQAHGGRGYAPLSTSPAILCGCLACSGIPQSGILDLGTVRGTLGRCAGTYQVRTRLPGSSFLCIRKYVDRRHKSHRERPKRDSLCSQPSEWSRPRTIGSRESWRCLRRSVTIEDQVCDLPPRARPSEYDHVIAGGVHGTVGTQ